jgi:hypothetical protein
MSVWVSELFKFRAGLSYGSLSCRLSIEIPKGERTGLTPAQRKVYGKSQMVRPRRATLWLLFTEMIPDLKTPFEVCLSWSSYLPNQLNRSVAASAEADNMEGVLFWWQKVLL